MYYVYILQCNDDSLYTGITTDISRRILEHKSGKGARYTRARGVKELLHTERKKNRSTASLREAQIKAMTRAEKLTLISVRKNNTLDGVSKKH